MMLARAALRWSESIHLTPSRARSPRVRPTSVQLLHVIAGGSYYKAAIPQEIRIDGYDIDAATAALLETVYLNGLGEFAYRNGLSLQGRIKFPVARVSEAHPGPEAPANASRVRPLALPGLRRRSQNNKWTEGIQTS